MADDTRWQGFKSGHEREVMTIRRLIEMTGDARDM